MLEALSALELALAPVNVSVTASVPVLASVAALPPARVLGRAWVVVSEGSSVPLLVPLSL